jgi:hypothetical protein
VVRSGQSALAMRMYRRPAGRAIRGHDATALASPSSESPSMTRPRRRPRPPESPPRGWRRTEREGSNGHARRVTRGKAPIDAEAGSAPRTEEPKPRRLWVASEPERRWKGPARQAPGAGVVEARSAQRAPKGPRRCRLRVR